RHSSRGELRSRRPAFPTREHLWPLKYRLPPCQFVTPRRGSEGLKRPVQLCNASGRAETKDQIKIGTSKGETAMAAAEVRDIAGGPRELKELPAHIPTSTGERLEALGTTILRYGLVFLLVGIGFTKFFAFEAKAIQPLVAHSPFVGWLYSVLDLQG